MLSKQYVSMRLLPIIVAFTLAFGFMTTVQRFDSYADESTYPTTTLNHIGAKVDVQWDLWNLSPEDLNNGNFDTFISYTPGTPVERTWTKAPIAWWSIKPKELSKCGPITKIELTDENGEILDSFTALDKEKGLTAETDIPGWGTWDRHPSSLSKDGKAPGQSQYDAYELWNVIDGQGENASTLCAVGVRTSDYVEICWGTADMTEAKEPETNHIINIYFNGAEDAPVIPEEVQAVIDAIDDIGVITEENYLSKGNAITAAKSLYEALETDEFKEQVTNRDDLFAAKAAYDEFKLAAAKTAAINELEDSFDKSNYSGEELTKLEQAIEDGKAAINAATSEETVTIAKSNALEEARKAKTDVQIAELALIKAKNDAKQEIDDKYDLTQYSGDEKAKIEKAIADAKTAIDAAKTVEAVDQAKKDGIAEADKAKTNKQINDEKKAEIAKKKAAAKKYTVKGLKVTSKSRKFTVTWKKTKGATGYQVQYKLKSAKKYKTLKNTTALKVISKKLKNGKKYQFRVRTYTKVETTKVYGVWTKVKTVKCNGRR